MNVVRLERKYGRNTHQRIDIGIDRLMNVEGAGGFSPTFMVEAYRRWLSAAQNGVTAEQDFYGAGLHSAPNYWIDVRADNPRAFRFNIITPAGSNTGRYSQHVSQIKGSIVSEHPILEMRTDMMLEYDACKRSKRASAYRLTHDVNGFVRDYVRLLLPVCDRQRHVTALLGYALHLEVPTG